MAKYSKYKEKLPVEITFVYRWEMNHASLSIKQFVHACHFYLKIFVISCCYDIRRISLASLTVFALFQHKL